MTPLMSARVEGNHGVTTIVVGLRRPPMTSNEQRRWHWTKVREAKKQAALAVWVAARAMRLGQRTTPVVVTVTWFAPDARGRDSDSLSPFLKAALDELVRMRVLVDDCAPHVAETRMRIEIDRTNPRIEIRLEETP